jgi:hypothetical protein
MNKLNEILNEVFPPDVVEIANQQEYLGMRLSGGIDSAFLCYLTMAKFPNKKIIPITMYNKIRPGAVDSVNRVIDVLQILNPDSIIVKPEIGYFDTTGFTPTKEMRENFILTGKKYNPKDIFQNQWFNTIFDKYEGKLNMLLSGETLNPPVDVQDTLVMSGEFPPDRNHKAARVFSSWSYNEFNRYEFRPFRNINKKELASWVKQLGLMKTLFPVTETCELEDVHYDMYSEMFNIEYKNPGIEPCRRCWPCREKWWAYGYYDFMVEEKQ